MVAQRSGRIEVGARREIDKLMAKLGTMPRILCWNCRQLTPFELDRCQHCGSAFAGSTGGAYGSGRTGTSRNVTSKGRTGSTRSLTSSQEALQSSRRSLTQIYDDLRRIHDVSALPINHAREKGVSLHLFQCPSCGRFVSEAATECACGVRFAPNTDLTFTCPECDSHVPGTENACPVCGVEFEPDARATNVAYACPRCGANVSSDAVRCSCGVWFEE